MIEIICLDLTTKKQFTKNFFDGRLARRFVIRCKYSKKIKVMAITGCSQEELSYISGY